MSIVWVTADWHLGHKNISKYRDVRSEEDNATTILTNYRAMVSKRDVVWFLGDICFTPAYLPLLQYLPGDKRLVLGNHDLDKGVPFADLASIFNRVCGLVSYKGFWLSHAPLHPDELRGKMNIHGHTHAHDIDDPRYINVCVERHHMQPVKFQEIGSGSHSSP